MGLFSIYFRGRRALCMIMTASQNVQDSSFDGSASLLYFLMIPASLECIYEHFLFALNKKQQK